MSQPAEGRTSCPATTDTEMIHGKSNSFRCAISRDQYARCRVSKCCPRYSADICNSNCVAKANACKGAHLWRQPRLTDVARLRTLNVRAIVRWERGIISVRNSRSQRISDCICQDPASGTSVAPDGPSLRTAFRPVATDRSSRNKYHSRYKRLENTLNTRSWKSSGPFVGPNVSPRGK